MRRIIIGFLLSLTSLVLYALSPVINDYESTVFINKDSTVVVNETINVTTDGITIRHGIYRDLPTQYKTIQGLNFDIGFKLLSVKLNGLPEESHLKKMSNGIRIYIGDENVSLPPGNYTYQIIYSVSRVLGFFPTHDEFYWNVTGNAWAFPILKASATINLPTDAKINETTAYTGAMYSTNKNYHVDLLQANQVYFTTTQALEPNEGLTVVVSWPTGIIQPPNLKMQIKNFIVDNHNVSFALIGYIVLIAFYILSWFYLGKDSHPKIIIPLYEPPAGFSPQSLGYIKDMGYDDKLFTSAIINMAVKKYLTIEEKSDHQYRLKKIALDDSLLTPPEKAISDELFKVTPTILMVQDNNKQISQAIDEFKKQLDKELLNKYFILNSPIILLGIALSVMSLMPLIVEQFNSLFVFCIIGIYGFFFLEPFIPHKLKSFKNFCLSVLSILLIILIFGIIFLPLIFDSLFEANWLSYLILALFLITNSLFLDLMRRPTPLGVEIVAQTLGFELFLKATEETQMNFRNPPDKTPQLFERYLPFALALGLEQAWCNQFSQILIQSQYQPDWYSGSYYNFSGTHFSEAVGSSLTSAISSSSIAPGSSSGFGGGGFSGGGGGGGGGGGW